MSYKVYNNTTSPITDLKGNVIASGGTYTYSALTTEITDLIRKKQLKLLAGIPTDNDVDRLGFITLGGTAQYLFDGVIPLNGFEIFNPSATSSLWISKVGVAAPNASGSIEIAPGALYMTPETYKVAKAISIYGDTTGQPFTAERW